MQLAFGWTTRKGEDEQFDLALFGGECRVQVWLRPKSVFFSVRQQSVPWGPALSVRLELGEDPWLRVSTEGDVVPPVGWSLRPQVRSSLSWDVFGAAAALIEAEGQRLDHPAARAEIARGMAMLRHAARHAHSLLVPQAQKVASRFASSSRLGLHALLEGDESGWLSQMARVCPGLLLFIVALKQVNAAAAAQALIHGIHAGRPLDLLLREATAAAVYFARWRALNPARCRLLLRRMGPRVPWSVFLYPPPQGFIPEDIPRSPRANAHWFGIMRAASAAVARGGFPDPRGVCAFVSRNAGCFQESEVPHLVSYAASSRQQWSRQSAVEPVLRLRRLWLKAPQLSEPERPLPQLSARFAQGDLEVTPLSTVGEVLEQAVQMKNCLADRVEALVEGRAFAFRVRSGMERFVVEVGKTPEGLTVNDARAFANRYLNEDEVKALRPWLSSLGIEQWPGALSPMPEGARPIREWMEFTLSTLDRWMRNEQDWHVATLEAELGVTAAWVREVTEAALLHRRPLQLSSPNPVGLLIVLLMRGSDCERLKLSKDEETRFQDCAARWYQAGHVLLRQEVVPEVPANRTRGESVQ